MSRADVAEVFSALGDRTRLSVVRKLVGGAQSATALSDGEGVTRQAVIKHLRVLEGAGLVTTEKRGREQLYVLDARPLDDAQAFLQAVSEKWDQALERLRALVEEPRMSISRREVRRPLRKPHQRRRT